MKTLTSLLVAAATLVSSATAVRADEAKSIVEVAAGNPDFSTLVAAVKAAGLVDTLSGTGPFTVFAPTNAAFAKLPKGTVEDLLKPENKAKLASILTYHVVGGKVMAKDVKPGAVKMVSGNESKISIDGKTVKIDAATVTTTDINCKNGIIHVIDSVILPPAK